MQEKPSRSHLKRQFFEDEDSNKPPAQKRVRFPKGKKVKPGEEVDGEWYISLAIVYAYWFKFRSVDVYHEKQDVFQREADINNPGVTSSVLPDSAVGTSNSKVTAAEVSSNAADGYDMFADDADDENLKPSSEPNSDAVIQSSSEAVNTFSETGDMQNDYVYDESSGYYYSSTLGYYYDPSTGLYCSAASGQWYSFNEATGTYDEVQETTGRYTMWTALFKSSFTSKLKLLSLLLSLVFRPRFPSNETATSGNNRTQTHFMQFSNKTFSVAKEMNTIRCNIPLRTILNSKIKLVAAISKRLGRGWEH
ncbi:hypothetical protein CRYUN_Cryun06bG0072000 [Craigia yunnanensis]